jgi:hypothetical protein
MKSKSSLPCSQEHAIVPVLNQVNALHTLTPSLRLILILSPLEHRKLKNRVSHAISL